ncbi:MAG: DUF3237 domain-containing protein [Polyangiaceae bacterium]|nr:DUF3237 domain-containing protein [Polyangiaceae bacterium]
MPELRAQHLFTLSLEIGSRRAVGQGPFGYRRITHVTGGRFEGPRISGRVLPGSGDWPLVGPGGALRIDARLTLEASDGEIIYMSYQGICGGPPEVLERLGRGEEVDPSLYHLRVAALFEAAAPQHEWLGYVVAIGVGRRMPGRVEYDVHEVL